MRTKVVLAFITAILVVSVTFASIVYLAERTIIGDEAEFDIIEVSYNDHQYLVFDGQGIIHDPNCDCKKD